MEKMYCAINRMLDFQLGSGSISGHSDAASVTGFDVMTMMPLMIIPFLLVLMAGLWMMDQYRRKTSI